MRVSFAQFSLWEASSVSGFDNAGHLGQRRIVLIHIFISYTFFWHLIVPIVKWYVTLRISFSILTDILVCLSLILVGLSYVVSIFIVPFMVEPRILAWRVAFYVYTG